MIILNKQFINQMMSNIYKLKNSNKNQKSKNQKFKNN